MPVMLKTSWILNSKAIFWVQTDKATNFRVDSFILLSIIFQNEGELHNHANRLNITKLYT